MYKIMIIDDDATSLAIGRAFLEDDFELSLIYSGQQALGVLNHETLPDLILLDMLMPGINGLEVLAIIKNDEKLKDIPVIFLTGERQVDLEKKGYRGGASDFLQKPVDQYLLKMKIQHQLSYVELKRENLELKARLNLIEGETAASSE